MESMEPDKLSTGGAKSFFKHVFNFDDDSKNEMLNIMQYSLLAIIPVVFLNKCIQRFIPETDETKGSLEVFVEIIGQIICMFIGILFIHRLITFIPTYSKTKYADFNVTNIVLVFLVIVLSLQTKLGEKVNLLLERIMEIIDGKVNIKEGNSNNTSQTATTSGYIDNQNYQTNPMMNVPPQLQQQQPQQKQTNPDFQNMYSGPTTTMPDAATPTMNTSTTPIETFDSPLLAANEALGGSFGSAF